MVLTGEMIWETNLDHIGYLMEGFQNKQFIICVDFLRKQNRFQLVGSWFVGCAVWADFAIFHMPRIHDRKTTFARPNLIQNHY